MAEIEPPYLTTFEWQEPAQSVSLAGTFTKWKKVPLKKGKEDKWRKVFHLRPGRHQYHFIVDGERKLLPIKTVSSRNPNTPGERENVRRIRHQPALIGERADKEEVGAHNPTYWREEDEEEEGESEDGEYEEEHEAEHEDVEEEEEDEIHESDREAMHALVEEERQRQIEDESRIPEEIHDSNREDLQKQVEDERQRLMEQEEEIVSEIREKERERAMECERKKEKEKESSKSQPKSGPESDQAGGEPSADEAKIIDVHEDDEAKSREKVRTPPPSPSLKPEINEDIDILDAALQSDGEETIKVRPRLKSDRGSAMHQGTLEPTLEVEPPTAKNVLESLSLSELERKKRQLSKRIGFFGGLGLGKVLGFGLLVGAAVAAVYFIAKPSRRERSSNQ